MPEAAAEPPEVAIGDRRVGGDHPVYVIAELSANHGQRLDTALALVEAAAASGADAVKLQTYTPDTMTFDVDRPEFRVSGGTQWDGRTLHDLYAEAMTPWEWHGPLQAAAHDAGIELFSSPFDRTAVDFLDELGTPAFKIASFELVDHGLIECAASKGRPLIMSTGMATAEEIDDAVRVARSSGAAGVILLHCNSTYPAPVDEMDLRTIPDMQQRWNVPVGLSDHTMTASSTTLAVALGACVIEKHLTLDRTVPGPDSAFSLEPAELRDLVTAVREAEQALGRVRYGPSPTEQRSLAFRRSLRAARDIAAGEVLSADDVRAARPAGGLAPKHLPEVIGRTVRRPLARGEALDRDALD